MYKLFIEIKRFYEFEGLCNTGTKEGRKSKCEKKIWYLSDSRSKRLGRKKDVEPVPSSKLHREPWSLLGWREL